jgi:hypothetical protein
MHSEVLETGALTWEFVGDTIQSVLLVSTLFATGIPVIIALLTRDHTPLLALAQEEQPVAQGALHEGFPVASFTLLHL